MKPSKRFFFKLYLLWFLWVSIYTLVCASVISLVFTLFSYFYTGAIRIDHESMSALKEIFAFSFPFSFSLSFILMLLLVFKALIGKNIEGFKLHLYDCEGKRIDKVLLSDILPIWRKWLFSTVWTIALFWVIFIAVWRLITGELPPISSFNGLSLYLLVITFGGAVFVLGMKFCKKIRIQQDG